jgi:hypothetical protein
MTLGLPEIKRDLITVLQTGDAKMRRREIDVRRDESHEGWYRSAPQEQSVLNGPFS